MAPVCFTTDSARHFRSPQYGKPSANQKPNKAYLYQNMCKCQNVQSYPGLR